MNHCMRRSTHGLPFALICSIVVVCGGCGTAEYETKLDGAVKKMRIDNKFRDLDRKETLIATLGKAKVVFRKPSSKFFPDLAFTEGAADPQKPSELLAADRLKPSLLPDFPGFQFSYESVIRRPLTISSLYVGAQTADAAMHDRIVMDLKSQLPESVDPPRWTEISVETPDGGTARCKTIEVRSTQNFWIPGNDQYHEMPGTFVIWLREQQGIQVLLSLRTTASGDALETLKNQIAVAVGTVRIVTD